MEKLAYYFAYPNGLSQVILRISVRQTFHGMLDETVTHHHPPPAPRSPGVVFSYRGHHALTLMENSGDFYNLHISDEKIYS